MGVAIGFLIGNIILIFTKTIYLAWKMNISLPNVVNNVLGGWVYGLYFVPLLLAQYYIVPENWLGEIVSAIIFTMMIVGLFIIWPDLIGRQYKHDGAEKIRKTILRKIKR